MKARPIQGRHTLSQAALLLGLSRKELLREIHSGPLVARKLGRQLYVHSEDLAAYRRGLK